MKSYNYRINLFHGHLLLGELELPLRDESVLVPVHGLEGGLTVHVQVQKISRNKQIIKGQRNTVHGAKQLTYKERGTGETDDPTEK